MKLFNLGLTFDTLTESFSWCLITQNILVSGDIVGSTRVTEREHPFEMYSCEEKSLSKVSSVNTKLKINSRGCSQIMSAKN